MINLTTEKECKLSSQQRFDIINFALQSCESDGFLNGYVFERALYLYAADVLMPDKKAEIIQLITEGILIAWDTLLENGTIEALIEEYQNELNVLSDDAKIWFADFETYSNSARGLLNNIQEFTGDIVASAAEYLQQSGNENVTQILDFGKKWGMDPLPENE